MRQANKVDNGGAKFSVCLRLVFTVSEGCDISPQAKWVPQRDSHKHNLRKGFSFTSSI
jgi:hypothetical protein